MAALPDAATQEHDAARLLATLNENGGTYATDELESLPAGVFWHTEYGAH